MGGSTIRAFQSISRSPGADGFATSGAAGSASPGDSPRAQDLPSAQIGSGGPVAAPPGAARQMVYTARFEIATSNVEEAMGQFIRGAQGAGGYLESREDSRVVCRVPAARFQGDRRRHVLAGQHCQPDDPQ